MNSIRVVAPARLHLGMFDPGGSLGRRFGGLGVAVGRPQVILEARMGQELMVEGPGASRVQRFAQRYLTAYGIQTGAHLSIKENIPGHVGLGSGTKLALAVAHALANLYDQPVDPIVLAQAVGRGSRSTIGLWTYAQGGLVVEGGQWPERDDLAPLLMRYPMPASWSCVLAVPKDAHGLSGETEDEAFQNISPSQEQAAAISHVVLMALLPALVEGQLDEFGAALTQVQRLVGECFSPVQGDRFANPLSAELIGAMLEWGAAGAGQSSWGPAVYGLVEGQEQGQSLKANLQAILGDQGWVELVSFDNDGVQVQNL
jgi:beta-ribofuranosylaminobenzene 5'-phosphate synthase